VWFFVDFQVLFRSAAKSREEVAVFISAIACQEARPTALTALVP
jgi:hypothetical protein